MHCIFFLDVDARLFDESTSYIDPKNRAPSCHSMDICFFVYARWRLAFRSSLEKNRLFTSFAQPSDWLGASLIRLLLHPHAVFSESFWRYILAVFDHWFCLLAQRSHLCAECRPIRSFYRNCSRNFKFLFCFSRHRFPGNHWMDRGIDRKFSERFFDPILFVHSNLFHRFIFSKTQ